MAPSEKATAATQINTLVEHFNRQRHLFQQMVENLRNAFDASDDLRKLIHSHKFRIKDPEHLRDKLQRKAHKATEAHVPFDITTGNLAQKINDLAGFRIIHLHTRQFESINKTLLDIFEFNNYPLIEQPRAKTWDDETREYFASLGVAVEPNDRMYTSVHYVVGSNSKAQVTCEIQVRTLSEEIWGEVDHKVNYPHPNDDVSCREQIKVLARVTSSCSRLVDSIFATHTDRENVRSKNGIEVPRTRPPKRESRARGRK
ncbi:RelA/SpoT domain-containing protein [Corallococcus exiguus]|uniref:RelA/SpoT domain-containing protein n=1 Tax=Corallococcus exiguus TaxID=83462 RepID=UPI00155FDD6A|nr:RelA/SpoT domain-containing protein [Corallococcus exiguus]NRD58776.1 RelA/SpoT domain-containing protein [Corallococcus exiguus]